MQAAGLDPVRICALVGGIATIHVGVKGGESR